MTPVVKTTFVFLIFLWTNVRLDAQINFCAVGDVLLDRGVRKTITENNILYPFEKVKNIIGKNDIAFFNLECPIADSLDGYALNKRYSFRADSSFVEGIEYAGFNIASVANNHTIDYGKAGFLKTIEILKTNNIYPVGGGKNQTEAFKPLLIEKKGETIAFFAVLEFLLDGTTYNENQPYPAFGQIDRLCKLIRGYNSKVDIIIVSFHWGIENVILPTSRQIEYAHKVVDAGADIVLGHHPHVIQSIETYRNKLIIYSLGNFVFDNSDELQKESMVFQCQFSKGKILNPHLIPIQIVHERPEQADDKTSYKIFNHLKKISAEFNTSFTFEKNTIQINHLPKKPVKELFYNNLKFDLFKQKIQINMDNYLYTYILPDTNYQIIDACNCYEDDVVYLYTIVENIGTNRSRIAIFPYSLKNSQFLQPSLDVHDDFNPWKIEVFDVDHDENPEIILGVNKTTRYDDVQRKRIFVLNRERDYMFPKWLGSKMGNLIIDFDIDYTNNRLLVLENSNKKNKNRIVSYVWNGFGFDNDKVLYEIENDKKLKTQLSALEFMN